MSEYGVQEYHIRKTFQCNVYPLEPYFNKAKLGYGCGISISLIFAPKHRLWVLVRTVSNVYPPSMF